MRGQQVDVAVVGAGPAGATAARSLAEAGVRVALIERESLPRYKTCGGGLVGRALGGMPQAVAVVVERACCRAHLHAADAPITIARPAPLVSMVMRDRLDHFLAERARVAGATLRVSSGVESVAREEDGLRLEAGSTTLRTRFLIAADGATGRMAEQLGFRDGRRLVPALEAEIRPGAGAPRRLWSEARFDFGIMPHGYAWVFPKDDHLSIGVLSMRRGSVGLPAALERYYRFLEIEPGGSEARHGYVIPVRPRRGVLARDRVFLVGDAAGLADPVTGEGISHAVLSGRLAAEALLASDLTSGAAEARYRILLRRQVLPELWRARLLARAFYGPSRLRNALFRRWGRPLGEALASVFDGRSSYREMFGAPVRRLLTGPTRS